ncbi:hypothetical protein Tco_0985796, partial [Tanacetum coccineum]
CLGLIDNVVNFVLEFDHIGLGPGGLALIDIDYYGFFELYCRLNVILKVDLYLGRTSRNRVCSHSGRHVLDILSLMLWLHNAAFVLGWLMLNVIVKVDSYLGGASQNRVCNHGGEICPYLGVAPPGCGCSHGRHKRVFAAMAGLMPIYLDNLLGDDDNIKLSLSSQLEYENGSKRGKWVLLKYINKNGYGKGVVNFDRGFVPITCSCLIKNTKQAGLRNSDKTLIILPVAHCCVGDIMNTSGLNARIGSLRLG